MAHLRLIGIQCRDLPPGESLSIWPHFLNGFVGSSPVTISDSNEVLFASDAVVNFQLRSDPIYLYINNDQTILVSEAHIWDTAEHTDSSTPFRLLIDTIGRQQVNYSPILHYTLN